MNVKNIKYQIIMILLFVSQLAQAQTDFDDDVQDIPAAPIDSYIIYAFIIITLYVFYKQYISNSMTK